MTHQTEPNYCHFETRLIHNLLFLFFPSTPSPCLFSFYSPVEPLYLIPSCPYSHQSRHTRSTFPLASSSFLPPQLPFLFYCKQCRPFPFHTHSRTSTHTADNYPHDFHHHHHHHHHSPFHRGRHMPVPVTVPVHVLVVIRAAFDFIDQLGLQRRQPPPIKFPRKRIDKDFAVMLLRSSYETTDELDFVPMDRFQKEFFLLRSQEYERYIEKTNVAMQGDVCDPLYFDFISFAQYATISKEMTNGVIVFEELQNADGDKVVVRRDPKLSDNALLPEAFRRHLGQKLFEKACTARPDLSLEPTTHTTVPAETIQNIMEEIYQWMWSAGFALSYAVELKSKTINCVKMVSSFTGPANLWGRHFLSMRGDLVLNDYDVFMVSHALSSLHLTFTVQSRQDRNRNAVVHTWNITTV